MKYSFRTKELELKNFIQLNQQHKDVLIVSGARQVGKSTIISHLLSSCQDKQVTKLDLEKTLSIAEKIDSTKDFKEFEGLIKDECAFVPAKNAVLFIDESQISRKLGQYIRFMKEDWAETTVILSGSLIGEIHNQDLRRPVGREVFLELWPFSFLEFLSAIGHDSLVKILDDFELGDTVSPSIHQRLLEDYDVYLKVGGMPAVIDAYIGGRDWYDVRLDIYKTYEDDFTRYFGIENVNLFNRALMSISANVGSPSKNSHVIKIDAPGYKKVPEIFARLELWKLVINVPQLGKVPEQLNFPPKRYLFDTGILNYLRFKGRPNFNVSELFDANLRTAIGGMIENAVAVSLKNQSKELVGIKLSKNSEIDFAIKNKQGFIPVECKSSQKFKLYHVTSVLNYCQMFHVKDGVVFNFDMPYEFKKGEVTIHSLPVYMSDKTLSLLSGY